MEADAPAPPMANTTVQPAAPRRVQLDIDADEESDGRSQAQLRQKAHVAAKAEPIPSRRGGEFEPLRHEDQDDHDSFWTTMGVRINSEPTDPAENSGNSDDLIVSSDLTSPYCAMRFQSKNSSLQSQTVWVLNVLDGTQSDIIEQLAPVATHQLTMESVILRDGISAFVVANGVVYTDVRDYICKHGEIADLHEERVVPAAKYLYLTMRQGVESEDLRVYDKPELGDYTAVMTALERETGDPHSSGSTAIETEYTWHSGRLWRLLSTLAAVVPPQSTIDKDIQEKNDYISAETGILVSQYAFQHGHQNDFMTTTGNTLREANDAVKLANATRAIYAQEHPALRAHHSFRGTPWNNWARVFFRCPQCNRKAWTFCTDDVELEEDNGHLLFCGMTACAAMGPASKKALQQLVLGCRGQVRIKVVGAPFDCGSLSELFATCTEDLYADPDVLGTYLSKQIMELPVDDSLSEPRMRFLLDVPLPRVLPVFFESQEWVETFYEEQTSLVADEQSLTVPPMRFVPHQVLEQLMSGIITADAEEESGDEASSATSATEPDPTAPRTIEDFAKEFLAKEAKQLHHYLVRQMGECADAKTVAVKRAMQCLLPFIVSAVVAIRDSTALARMSDEETRDAEYVDVAALDVVWRCVHIMCVAQALDRAGLDGDTIAVNVLRQCVGDSQVVLGADLRTALTKSKEFLLKHGACDPLKQGRWMKGPFETQNFKDFCNSVTQDLLRMQAHTAYMADTACPGVGDYASVADETLPGNAGVDPQESNGDVWRLGDALQIRTNTDRALLMTALQAAGPGSNQAYAERIEQVDEKAGEYACIEYLRRMQHRRLLQNVPALPLTRANMAAVAYLLGLDAVVELRMSTDQDVLQTMANAVKRFINSRAERSVRETEDGDQQDEDDDSEDEDVAPQNDAKGSESDGDNAPTETASWATRNKQRRRKRIGDDSTEATDESAPNDAETAGGSRRSGSASARKKPTDRDKFRHVLRRDTPEDDSSDRPSGFVDSEEDRAAAVAVAVDFLLVLSQVDHPAPGSPQGATDLLALVHAHCLDYYVDNRAFADAIDSVTAHRRRKQERQSDGSLFYDSGTGVMTLQTLQDLRGALACDDSVRRKLDVKLDACGFTDARDLLVKRRELFARELARVQASPGTAPVETEAVVASQVQASQAEARKARAEARRTTWIDVFPDVASTYDQQATLLLLGVWILDQAALGDASAGAEDASDDVSEASDPSVQKNRFLSTRAEDEDAVAEQDSSTTDVALRREREWELSKQDRDSAFINSFNHIDNQIMEDLTRRFRTTWGISDQVSSEELFPSGGLLPHSIHSAAVLHTLRSDQVADFLTQFSAASMLWRVYRRCRSQESAWALQAILRYRLSLAHAYQQGSNVTWRAHNLVSMQHLALPALNEAISQENAPSLLSAQLHVKRDKRPLRRWVHGQANFHKFPNAFKTAYLEPVQVSRYFSGWCTQWPLMQRQIEALYRLNGGPYSLLAAAPAPVHSSPAASTPAAMVAACARFGLTMQRFLADWARTFAGMNWCAVMLRHPVQRTEGRHVFRLLDDDVDDERDVDIRCYLVRQSMKNVDRDELKHLDGPFVLARPYTRQVNTHGVNRITAHDADLMGPLGEDVTAAYYLTTQRMLSKFAHRNQVCAKRTKEEILRMKRLQLDDKQRHNTTAHATILSVANDRVHRFKYKGDKMKGKGDKMKGQCLECQAEGSHTSCDCCRPNPQTLCNSCIARRVMKVYSVCGQELKKLSDKDTFPRHACWECDVHVSRNTQTRTDWYGCPCRLCRQGYTKNVGTKNAIEPFMLCGGCHDAYQVSVVTCTGHGDCNCFRKFLWSERRANLRTDLHEAKEYDTYKQERLQDAQQPVPVAEKVNKARPVTGAKEATSSAASAPVAAPHMQNEILDHEIINNCLCWHKADPLSVWRTFLAHEYRLTALTECIYPLDGKLAHRAYIPLRSVLNQFADRDMTVCTGVAKARNTLMRMEWTGDGVSIRDAFPTPYDKSHRYEFPTTDPNRLFVNDPAVKLPAASPLRSGVLRAVASAVQVVTSAISNRHVVESPMRHELLDQLHQVRLDPQTKQYLHAAAMISRWVAESDPKRMSLMLVAARDVCMSPEPRLAQLVAAYKWVEAASKSEFLRNPYRTDPTELQESVDVLKLMRQPLTANPESQRIAKLEKAESKGSAPTAEEEQKKEREALKKDIIRSLQVPYKGSLYLQYNEQGIRIIIKKLVNAAYKAEVDLSDLVRGDKARFDVDWNNLVRKTIDLTPRSDVYNNTQYLEYLGSLVNHPKLLETLKHLARDAIAAQRRNE